jgi:hypothetical protein
MDSWSSSRRSFLKLAGCAGAPFVLPGLLRGQGTQAAGKTPAVRPASSFEVDGTLYPWDVHDEGIETILDNMTQLAGVNTVYLICLMHHEGRPLTSKQYPHNPARARWDTEDSCAYFHPQGDRYGRIKPALSRHDWLRSTDWLQVVIDAARARLPATRHQ